jgi:hypothetical protein
MISIKKITAAAVAIARDPSFVATEPDGSARGRPGTFIEALSCLPDGVECVRYTPADWLAPLSLNGATATATATRDPILFALDSLLENAVTWEAEFRRMRGKQWRTVTVNGQTFIINVHSRRIVEFTVANEDDASCKITVGTFSKAEYRATLIDAASGEHMTADELDAEVEAAFRDHRRSRREKVAAFWNKRRACNDTSGVVDEKPAREPAPVVSLAPDTSAPRYVLTGDAALAFEAMVKDRLRAAEVIGASVSVDDVVLAMVRRERALTVDALSKQTA